MLNEERIVLACPYCQGELEYPLAWFRQSYFTCPACGGGLVAGQFAATVAELDTAFEASVTEMLRGAPTCGCNCGSSDCGG